MRMSLLWISVILVGCLEKKQIQDSRMFISNDYILLAQIEDINSDTINFQSIEMYAQSPLMRVSEDDSAKIEVIEYDLKKFKIGRLLNSVRLEKGEFVLLRINRDNIKNDDFLQFTALERHRYIDLSNMIKVGKHNH